MKTASSPAWHLNCALYLTNDLTPHTTVDRAGCQWAGNIFYAKIISQIQGEAWDMPGVKMTLIEGVWRRGWDSNSFSKPLYYRSIPNWFRSIPLFIPPKRLGLNKRCNENLTHEAGSKLRVTLGFAYWNLTSTLSASPCSSGVWLPEDCWITFCWT